MKNVKKILLIITIMSTILSGLIYVHPVEAKSNNSNVPKPNFTLASEGAILIESTTGKILYGKNEHKKLYPASTTKILTAILAIENCKPTDKITASYEAVMSLPAGYSNAAIQVGETLEFQDLLDMFLIHSANEIGNILAEHVSGSIEDFAKLMNQKTLELGCKNTHFTNPSGIHDENHYSTAYDMSLIAQYCMKNETFRNTVSKKSCTVEATDKYEKRYFKNTNDLLNTSSKYYYEYANGIKTGYTSQAKRCLIASSSKNNIELITVVLGSQPSTPDTRYLDTINLFEYGFSNYKFEQIATKNTVIEEILVGNATKDTQNLSLLLKDDISGLIPTNLNLTNLKPSIELNNLVAAPIEKDSVLGKITYNIDGTEYSSDLIASHSVEEFNPVTLLSQIGLALFILFLLGKLFFKKKKSKKRSTENKKSGNKKYKNPKKSSNSIYKF